jgi:hypothetical protein
MSLSKVMEIYQYFWTFESHHHQRLAWDDAAQAQLDAMLTANPSGFARPCPD